MFSRALKFGILMGSFNPKTMSLKSIEELSFMTMKNYAKSKEELTFHFKVDIRNLTNRHLNVSKLFILMDSF